MERLYQNFNRLDRIYQPPTLTVTSLAIENAICGGSVFEPGPDQTHQLTIERQDFNTSFDSAADLSEQGGWTPATTTTD